jgi:hypothetical protein
VGASAVYANTSLNFFLRAMPLAATRAAAARHDELIAAAFHDIACSHPAGPLCQDLALQPARLPVKMGGMGLTSMVSISPAAVVGTWTLCWETLQRLCPQVVRSIDLGGPPDDLPPSLAELAGVRAERVEQHAAVASRYAAASKCVCLPQQARRWVRRLPPVRPPRGRDPPSLVQYGSKSKHLQHAQRRYSSIVHHSAWGEVRTAWARVSQREAVRFVGASQEGAGQFLSAVPTQPMFRIPTPDMRICVQRRPGLPLSVFAGIAGVDSGVVARRGQPFDRLGARRGDVAQNSGEHGHQHRHFSVLNAIADIAKGGVGGTAAERKPARYKLYSTYRPELAISAGALHGVWGTCLAGGRQDRVSGRGQRG